MYLSVDTNLTHQKGSSAANEVSSMFGHVLSFGVVRYCGLSSVETSLLQTVVDCVKYLLLTEFEGRTLSYGPSCFLLDLWPKREERGPQIEGEKNEDP